MDLHQKPFEYMAFGFVHLRLRYITIKYTVLVGKLRTIVAKLSEQVNNY